MPSGKGKQKVKKNSGKENVKKLQRDLEARMKELENAKTEADKEKLQKEIKEIEAEKSRITDPMDEDTENPPADNPGPSEAKAPESAPEQAAAPASESAPKQAAAPASEPAPQPPQNHKPDGQPRKVKIEDEPSLFVPDNGENDNGDGSEEDSQVDEDGRVDEDGQVDEDGLRPLGSMTPGLTIQKDAETVAFGQRGRELWFINRIGPKSSCIYRVHPAATDAKWDAKVKDPLDQDKVTLMRNRYGDKRDEDTTDWKYKARHIQNIFGIAWDTSANPDDPLSLLDPSNKKFPRTYILVQWDIDGKFPKTWETRTCLRTRYKKRRADKEIYDKACEAQHIYEQVRSGNVVLPGRRSASRALGEERTRELRTRGSPFRSESPQVAPEVAAGTPDSVDDVLAQRLRTALMLHDTVVKKKMTDKEMGSFIAGFLEQNA